MERKSPKRKCVNKTSTPLSIGIVTSILCHKSTITDQNRLVCWKRTAGINGEIDDVELKRLKIAYYLFKIEGKSNIEAEVQIHAVSGEVLTISWKD